MSPITVHLAAPVPDLDRPLATPGARLLARLVDALLLAVVLVPVAVLGLVLLLRGSLHVDAASLAEGDLGLWWLRPLAVLALVGLLALVPFAYEFLLLRRDGQTIGKKVARVRVVRLVDGAPPSTGQAFLRTVLTAALGGLYVDALWCLVDPARQCLHDKAVDTVVVPA